MRRIVVLGCGFGGFRAARELERSLAGRRRVQVTVVSDRSHFLYTPLLPSVATGELDPSHITFPIRSAFDKSTDVLVEHVEAIDLQARTLRGRSQDVDFDYLLVASGSQTDWDGHPEWRSHALTCATARDAMRLRDAIADALVAAADTQDPDERRRRLTFVVGGAGPCGVELASELLTSLQTDATDEIADEIREAIRVVLVERRGGVLPDFAAELGELAAEHLAAQGIELQVGTEIVGRSEHAVELASGESIAADNFLWCGGMRPGPLAAKAGFRLDATGRIAVDPTLQCVEHAGVYAVGDIAAAGADIPQNAQVATQQAVTAARNIVAELSGRARRSWEYRHHGDLVTLGRDNALAYLGGSAIEGRAASALYRLVHTALMPTGVKKAQLLKDWVLTKRQRRSALWNRLEAAAPPQLSSDPVD